MNCPECNSENCEKVIACALPMKICMSCNTLFGFFSTFYAYVIAPIEMNLKGHTVFMTYDCGYLEALWVWLTTGVNDDN